MIRTARQLADLTSVNVALPRDTWVGEGWTHAATLPLKPRRFELKLRHASGAFGPILAHAEWNGAVFIAVKPMVASIDNAALGHAGVALFERFADNAGQWDLTAWRRHTAGDEASLSHD